MAEYIEREEVKEWIAYWLRNDKCWHPYSKGKNIPTAEVFDIISLIPAVDVVSKDAYDQVLKAARAMHTWIFLHSGNEELAYKACGLSDEMNAFLGYSGPYAVTVPADEKG